MHRPSTLIPHLALKSRPGTSFLCPWWRGANSFGQVEDLSPHVLDSWYEFGWEGRHAVVEDAARACCLCDVPQVNPDTGYINYDQLEENARLFHPKLIIAGDEPGAEEPYLPAAPMPLTQ